MAHKLYFVVSNNTNTNKTKLWLFSEIRIPERILPDLISGTQISLFTFCPSHHHHLTITRRDSVTLTISTIKTNNIATISSLVTVALGSLLELTLASPPLAMLDPAWNPMKTRMLKMLSYLPRPPCGNLGVRPWRPRWCPLPARFHDGDGDDGDGDGDDGCLHSTQVCTLPCQAAAAAAACGCLRRGPEDLSRSIGSMRSWVSSCCTLCQWGGGASSAHLLLSRSRYLANLDMRSFCYKNKSGT